VAETCRGHLRNGTVLQTISAVAVLEGGAYYDQKIGQGGAAIMPMERRSYDGLGTNPPAGPEPAGPAEFDADFDADFRFDFGADDGADFDASLAADYGADFSADILTPDGEEDSP
jgi:hypothetical protein